MLDPSRTLVATVALGAVVALVLGLATDVGLFGWSFAVLLALYLTVVGVAQRVRRRAVSPRRPA